MTHQQDFIICWTWIFWTKKEVTRKTRITVYKTTYIPIIMYRCESWPLSSTHNSQLQATAMRYLRKIEGKTKRDRIRNQIIRTGLWKIPFKEMTELAQLRWFGHVLRIRVRNIPKWPGKLEWRGRDWNVNPDRLGKTRCRRIWRNGKLNGTE
jgi:hypothetical protein